MDNQVLTSDNKETICPESGGNDGCSKTEKSWNHVTEAAECLLQVSTNPSKEKLTHCDASSKESTCNCLPVHLNGLIHNHIDHKSQERTPEGCGDVESSSSTSDLHNQSSVTASEHKCGNNCDYQTTQKPSDQETNSVSTKEEEELIAGVSALSVKNSSHDLDILEGIQYVVYQSEHQMPGIMRLITKDLSEPYSIYTYRYFIHNWPKLCFLAMHEDKCVGAIVCKLDLHKKVIRRGYIAMLAVDQEYRRKKIGSHLVLKAIRAMTEDECDEVVLETEITNRGALHLYEKLGFVRDKRLFRYYLNGVDALRLKLWLS